MPVEKGFGNYTAGNAAHSVRNPTGPVKPMNKNHVRATAAACLAAGLLVGPMRAADRAAAAPARGVYAESRPSQRERDGYG